MEIMILLFILAGFVAAIALAALFWTIKTRQYEDLKGAAVRILFDEEIR